MKRLLVIFLAILTSTALFSCGRVMIDDKPEDTSSKLFSEPRNDSDSLPSGFSNKQKTEPVSVLSTEDKTLEKKTSEFEEYGSYTVITAGESASFSGNLPFENVVLSQSFIDDTVPLCRSFLLVDGSEVEAYYKTSMTLRQSIYSQIDQYSIINDGIAGIFYVDHETGKQLSSTYTDHNKLDLRASDPGVEKLNEEQCKAVAWDLFEKLVEDSSQYSIADVKYGSNFRENVGLYRIEIVKYIDGITSYDKASFGIADTGDVISWNTTYIGSVDPEALPEIDGVKIDAIVNEVNELVEEYYGEYCERAESYVNDMTFMILDGVRPALQLEIMSQIFLSDDPGSSLGEGVILYVLL